MKKTIRIIGVPIDLGQSLRGVDLGPGALRYAGLATHLQQLGYRVNDIGNLEVPVRDTLGDQRRLHYLPAIQKVCEAAYQAGLQAIADGEIPVFIGGDHSLAIGSIGGVTHQEPAGILWIDAHGDFNTLKTTPSGNIHGMTLSVLLGDGYAELVNVGRPGAKLTADDVVMIGVRAIDSEERQRLRDSGICIYTMRDIDERGIGAVIREALQRLEHRQR
ncbi:arginase, partial [Trichloromonas sp.]|uniref:arginase n=1 Tax=Trichloromonas sp. TaxID=3069249 RepID=UPI003D813ECF